MSVAALRELQDTVKQARNNGYLNKYKDALKFFNRAQQMIKGQLSEISDKILLKEWQKLQFIIQQQKKLINQNLEPFLKEQINMKKKKVQNKMYSHQYPQFENKPQKKLPFGKQPFNFPIKKQEPNKYQQPSPHQYPPYQILPNNQYPPNSYPYQHTPSPYQNYYQANIPGLGMGMYIPPAQVPYKDPDVWDPPPPKQNYKYKPTNKKNNQPKNNSNVQAKRDYQKPWLNNAVGSKNKNNQGEQKKSFLYSVYPDGRGPDADLINMLQRDVIQLNPNVKFQDIAELDTAKNLLQQAVLLPLLMPQFFTGIRRPWKGVLTFGPPGTGKTLLAKAVATTGKTAFFNVSASSLASKWKGQSQKLVRLLFEMARFYAPSTIFFDQIDALGSKRGDKQNDAQRKVKSELLIQMDGISACVNNEKEDKKYVMVLAATNRPWDLDQALRRRLQKRIYIPLPTEVGRKTLFQLNLRGLSLQENINFDKLIKMTEGYSGADITNVCRQAAYMPMRRKLIKEGGIKNISNIQMQEVNVPLKIQDFLEALKNVNKSVGNENIKAFQKWMKQFGST